MAASGVLLQPSEAFKVAAFCHEQDAIIRANKPVRFFLIMIGGGIAATPIELLSFDTITSVQVLKNSQRGFFITQKNSLYGDEELMLDGFLHKGYSLADGEVLRMALHLSDLIAAFIKTVNGDRNVFQLHRNATIRDLKTCISCKDDQMALEEQLLSSKGGYFTDDSTIQDFPVENFLLYLCTQRPAKLRTKQIGGVFELLVSTLPLPRVRFAINSAKSLQPRRLPKDHGGSTVRKGPTRKNTNNQWQDSSRSKAFCRQGSIELAELHQGLEVPDIVRNLLEQVKSGLHSDQVPKLSSEGSGGVYFMKDKFGVNNVAVFKPMDEEPMAINNPRGFSSSNCKEGLRRGTQVGAGAVREVAAYLLDHPIYGPKGWKGMYQEGFAGVPLTIMVHCYHEALRWNAQGQRIVREAKLGSLQQFVNASNSCEDIGTSGFPVEEVHKITILDLRLANSDRNGGNILVCSEKDQSVKLVPIDHGYCLPEKFEDCTFEWLYWPQACHPYGPSALKYIASLDAEEDIKLLKHYGINLPPQSAFVLRVATMLLKKGAAAYLTPFQIGSIMSRQFPDVQSPIEVLLKEADSNKATTSDEAGFLKVLSGLVDSYITILKSSW